MAAQLFVFRKEVNRQMKVLITAGGTSEKIDEVRAITNHSSGQLGNSLAECFLARGHEVTYIMTPFAKHPEKQTNLTLLLIETTKNLEDVLKQQLQQCLFDAVIHSMAVSDFTTETALTEQRLIEGLVQQLSKHRSLLHDNLTEIIAQSIETIAKQVQIDKKIHSDTDRLVLFLKKNPKLIAMIRQLQPCAVFVGFKLLVDVSKEELIQVGLTTLEKNQCDFVLANDLTMIQGEQHQGFLIDKNKHVQIAQTKQEIAKLIVKNVEEKWRENEK